MSPRVLILSAVGLVVLGGAAWYFSGPYRLASELDRAIASRDDLALLEALDSPRIRAVVKNRLMEQAAQAQARNEPHPVLSMGPGMASLMAERTGWELASAEGFSRIFGGGSIGGGIGKSSVRPQGLSTFSITPASGNGWQAIVAWEGTGWKVVDVVGPGPTREATAP